MLDAGLAQEDFLPVVADLTKEAEVSALPRIVAKRWPGAGIDVLINNAGESRAGARIRVSVCCLGGEPVCQSLCSAVLPG